MPKVYEKNLLVSFRFVKTKMAESRNKCHRRGDCSVPCGPRCLLPPRRFPLVPVTESGVILSYPRFDGHLGKGTNNLEEVFDDQAEAVHIRV